jgi:hypothetical protein
MFVKMNYQNVKHIPRQMIVPRDAKLQYCVVEEFQLEISHVEHYLTRLFTLI